MPPAPTAPMPATPSRQARYDDSSYKPSTSTKIRADANDASVENITESIARTLTLKSEALGAISQGDEEARVCARPADLESNIVATEAQAKLEPHDGTSRGIQSEATCKAGKAVSRDASPVTEENKSASKEDHIAMKNVVRSQASTSVKAESSSAQTGERTRPSNNLLSLFGTDEEATDLEVHTSFKFIMYPSLKPRSSSRTRANHASSSELSVNLDDRHATDFEMGTRGFVRPSPAGALLASDGDSEDDIEDKLSGSVGLETQRYMVERVRKLRSSVKGNSAGVSILEVEVDNLKKSLEQVQKSVQASGQKHQDSVKNLRGLISEELRSMQAAIDSNKSQVEAQLRAFVEKHVEARLQELVKEHREQATDFSTRLSRITADLECLRPQTPQQCSGGWEPHIERLEEHIAVSGGLSRPSSWKDDTSADARGIRSLQDELAAATDKVALWFGEVLAMSTNIVVPDITVEKEMRSNCISSLVRGPVFIRENSPSKTKLPIDRLARLKRSTLNQFCARNPHEARPGPGGSSISHLGISPVNAGAVDAHLATTSALAIFKIVPGNHSIAHLSLTPSPDYRVQKQDIYIRQPRLPGKKGNKPYG
ncbi:hypothetical protein CONPUDRAFT_73478 [Coniophora puteana RWD-64-598 SS2]|uniref:Uncharacterized protein n=1 Tax=Coniophora puteana (strain RWD-64-598) TaxID=741705 RepID=A0A5M3MMT7_CONPW|nr:uncharacterized protein CONPUDRAFT_73478 [Coniophora puteana RWD-64-598 SS2]EIW80330.1 hypothetical protein CONPUDRAFT_73478 [Coniophora puteana RWD-64-598 SS2]